MALDCLDTRKNEYKSAGVDYFQPWLVLMTDGAPNGSSDELKRAISRTNELANNRGLTIFPIGIGSETDMACLAKFSPPRPPLRLKGTNFKGFFEWLSARVSRTSQSMPGDKIKLNFNAKVTRRKIFPAKTKLRGLNETVCTSLPRSTARVLRFCRISARPVSSIAFLVSSPKNFLI